MSNHNEALALCGGGGKGAYQVGVLKAMCENHVIDRFHCISGTSVGALNAVLFALGDSELAESVWLNYISPETMLKRFDPQKIEISRDTLKHILNKIGLSKIRSCNKKIYIYVHAIGEEEPTAYLLNDKEDERIINLLLASSAMPIVYAPVPISRNEYIDGGITPLGNTPVKVLVENGYSKITVIALDNEFNPRSLRNKGINLYSLFPKENFDFLRPSMYIGDLIDGTLDFSKESIKKRILIGQFDAKLKYRERTNTSMSEKEKIITLASETLHCANDFVDFIAFASFKNLNIDLPVLGGEVWYENIYKKDGWSIQRHNGLIPNHYRILDPDNVRKAWTLDPNELILQLLNYKNHIETRAK